MSSGLTPEEQFALRSVFGLRLSNSMKQNGPLCVGIDPHRKVLSEWGYQVNAEGAELYAMRMLHFGLRLSNSMKQNGPLCVGIDPHRKVLSEWGYQVNAEGAELYAMRMLQAASGRAAAVKFQSSMFERYGAKGYAALERVLYAARQMDIITIVDCLHGGLSTTISAIADAYFKQDAPMLADAITLLPYYGARSLSGVINDALDHGRGVFIASLTSNPEGASLQTAIRQTGEYKGKTVAYGIACPPRSLRSPTPISSRARRCSRMRSPCCRIMARVRSAA